MKTCRNGSDVGKTVGLLRLTGQTVTNNWLLVTGQPALRRSSFTQALMPLLLVLTNSRSHARFTHSNVRESFKLAVGEYAVTMAAEGYQSFCADQTINTDTASTLNAILTPIP